jgi:hypothetical protein
MGHGRQWSSLLAWPGSRVFIQGRMARGVHRLPKVSPGPAMPDPSTSCGRAIPETALHPFHRWSSCRAGGLWPTSTPSDTPRTTPMGPGSFFNFLLHSHPSTTESALGLGFRPSSGRTRSRRKARGLARPSSAESGIETLALIGVWQAVAMTP